MTEPDQIPPRLARAFAGLRGPTPPVPSTVDEAIRRAAATRLRSWPLRLRRRWLPLAAAALFLVWLALRGGALPGDVDGNGRVDILDAFALTRMLESGTTPDRRLDLTGDGMVDRRDVQVIARRAVALDGAAR